MTQINTEIKLIHENYKNGTWEIPEYATIGSAAVDIRAAIDEPITILPFETQFIPAGFAVHFDDPNYVLIMAPRSGSGCKKHITLGNTIGIIDSDYQGEIQMCVYNKRLEDLIIEPGDRICQMVLMPKVTMKFNIVDDFSTATSRGENGFGHTG